MPDLLIELLLTALQLNTLVREGIVTDYPPLVDPAPGAMTAQYVSDPVQPFLHMAADDGPGAYHLDSPDVQGDHIKGRRLLDRGSEDATTTIL